MIRSYTSELGKDLFEGNWSTQAKRYPIDPLDDCFIDLRILDAAACETDLLRAFQSRITRLDNRGGGYRVREPNGCSFCYQIEFVWTGANVEQVDVSFSPPANQQLKRAP